MEVRLSVPVPDCVVTINFPSGDTLETNSSYWVVGDSLAVG